MVTPFDTDGQLDEAAAVRLMRHLLDHGSDGLVLAGTTGEGSTLTDEEKIRLWELAVSEVGDEAYLIAGTGSNDTAHSVHLTEKATEVGVDAHLVVCPYYNKPNRLGLIGHYHAIARATDKPVILYNIPSRCVVDIPNELPPVSVDPKLMQRVFASLVGNVAKHTPAGTLATIEARRAGERIEVSVTDEGPGLPRGREEEVFESFARGERQGVRRGAGLGLAISRAIVEAHGGTIRAEAGRDKGARFVITLPIA